MKLQTYTDKIRFLRKVSEMKTGQSELSIVLKGCVTKHKHLKRGTKGICFIELPIKL